MKSPLRRVVRAMAAAGPSYLRYFYHGCGRVLCRRDHYHTSYPGLLHLLRHLCVDGLLAADHIICSYTYLRHEDEAQTRCSRAQRRSPNEVLQTLRDKSIK